MILFQRFKLPFFSPLFISFFSYHRNSYSINLISTYNEIKVWRTSWCEMDKVRRAVNYYPFGSLFSTDRPDWMWRLGYNFGRKKGKKEEGFELVMQLKLLSFYVRKLRQRKTKYLPFGYGYEILELHSSY